MALRLLSRQLELQVESFGIDPTELGGHQLADFVRWNVLAADDELHEALHEVHGWKPWGRDVLPHIEDRDAYVEELVDAAHFLANLLLAAGVDDDEFEQVYERKREVNVERQRAAAAG